MGEAPDVILVLGMHRSGTSAFTRVLNLLGVELGAGLMPAGPANERGFWEPSDLVALHDRLLERLGTAWSQPWWPSDRWWRADAVADLRSELALRLGERLAGTTLAAVKDPRLCRLVPLWRETLRALGRRPAALLVSRHPTEVAASLARRDGIAPARSHLLWLDHGLAAEADTRGLPRAFAGYDALLADWRDTMERVRSRLGIPAWPVSPDTAAPEIEAFLSDALRHHRRSGGDGAAGGEAGLPRPVAALHRELRRAAEEGESPALLRRVRTLHTRLREAADLYLPWAAPLDAELRAAREERERLARELALREELLVSERRTFASVAGARDEEVAGLRREIELRDALIDSERQSFAALQGALEHAGKLLVALEGERDEARAWATERARALAPLHEELEGLRREARTLREEAGGLHAELRDAQRARASAEGAAARSEQAAADLAGARDAAARERDEARARVAALEAELGTARREFAGARDELDRMRAALAAELEATRALLEQTRAAAAASDGELQRLLASRSWRLTGPLRRSVGLLRALLPSGGDRSPPPGRGGD